MSRIARATIDAWWHAGAVVRSDLTNNTGIFYARASSVVIAPTSELRTVLLGQALTEATHCGIHTLPKLNTTRQMVFGPRWNDVAKVFSRHSEDDVRVQFYSPGMDEKYKAFSSSAEAGVSWLAVKEALALRARETAMSATTTPTTASTAATAVTAGGSSKKAAGSSKKKVGGCLAVAVPRVSLRMGNCRNDLICIKRRFGLIYAC